MKNAKKFLSALLAALLLITTAPLACFVAFAEEQNGFTYKITDGEATVTGYDEAIVTGDVIIPDTLGGCPVTALDSMLFMLDDKITSVDIPNSVTTIGKSAFYCCMNLVSISLPDGLTELSEYCIAECENLAEIQLPDTLVKLGEMALNGCKSLKKISLPASVTELGDGSLGGTGITGFVVPDTVTEISARLFAGCKSLESVTIPNTVKSIGEYAFYNCESLKSIIIPSSVMTIQDNAFLRSGIEEIDIPSSVTYLGQCAFEFCSSLNKVTVRNPECVMNSTSHLFYNKDRRVALYGIEGSTLQAHAGTYYYYVTFTAIPADSHEHNFVVSEETPADCVTDGERTYVCTGEDCTETYTVTLPSTGHFVTKLSPKAATCTEDGRTYGCSCIYCGYKVEQTVIPATGHSDTDGDEKCDVCGANMKEEETTEGATESTTDSAVVDPTDDETGDGCICHKGSFVSKIVRFFYSLLTKISKLFSGKAVTCCDDMEFLF